ncbi:MAG TPA: hypothetical protein VGD60_02410 [Candidatus Acidoferrales bacterium]
MKKSKSALTIRPTRHKNRSAHRLANQKIEMHWLTGGGHLANLSLLDGSPATTNLNLVWESPWATIEPQQYSARKHAHKYGGGAVAQMLAAYTGHALCLDYFGAASPEEEAVGLPLHGEAGFRRWSVAKKSVRNGALKFSTKGAAPSAGLAITREVTMRENESVAFVTETVTNKNNRDRYFQWVQHATFGAPLLKENESICAIPGTRSKTSSDDYDGKCALETDREFAWPHAPAAGGGILDIEQPFTRKGRGFVATTLLGGGNGGGAGEPISPFTYVAVLNWRLGLVAGYLFRRADFPWAAIWEENCARQDEPWKGTSQARGLEFGNTPFPLGLHHAIMSGPLFNTPSVGYVPAHGKKSASYAIFAAEIPRAWRKITSIDAATAPTTGQSSIAITGPTPSDRVELRASALSEIWPAAK